MLMVLLWRRRSAVVRTSRWSDRRLDDSRGRRRRRRIRTRRRRIVAVVAVIVAWGKPTHHYPDNDSNKVGSGSGQFSIDSVSNSRIAIQIQTRMTARWREGEKNRGRTGKGIKIQWIKSRQCTMQCNNAILIMQCSLCSTIVLIWWSLWSNRIGEMESLYQWYRDTGNNNPPIDCYCYY